jgi:hypothetical protein
MPVEMQIPPGAMARKLIHAVIDDAKESSRAHQSRNCQNLKAWSRRDRTWACLSQHLCATKSSENPPDVDDVAQAHSRQDSEQPLPDVGLGKT